MAFVGHAIRLGRTYDIDDLDPRVKGSTVGMVECALGALAGPTTRPVNRRVAHLKGQTPARNQHAVYMREGRRPRIVVDEVLSDVAHHDDKFRSAGRPVGGASMDPFDLVPAGAAASNIQHGFRWIDTDRCPAAGSNVDTEDTGAATEIDDRSRVEPGNERQIEIMIPAPGTFGVVDRGEFRDLGPQLVGHRDTVTARRGLVQRIDRLHDGDVSITFRIPTARQGQTGMGQGGYGCYQLQQAIGEPVSIALRSPLPLETDLAVIDHGDRWTLVDPQRPDTIILEATRWDSHFAATEPVSVASADAARAAFPLTDDEHPAPHCCSCGTGPESLRVHAGPLGDGRWATPFRIPETHTVDGRIDESLVWMAVDCACGWFTSHSGDQNGGRGVTVQFAVDIVAPIEAETDYALVAWPGDYAPDWDGRKRGAAAMLFDRDGAVVARSRSFWVRPATG